MRQAPAYGPYVAEPATAASGGSSDSGGSGGDSGGSDSEGDGQMNEGLGQQFGELGGEERPTTRWR